MSKKYFIYLLGVVALYFAGCKAGGNYTGREYMPDMAHSKAIEAYVKTPTIDGEPLFANGSSARLPVSGTIARGYMPYSFPNSEDGYNQAGNSLINPYHADRENAAKTGKELYNIYCAVCHGEGGKGDGSIVKNGPYPPPPSYFKDETYMTLAEGKMMHSTQYGKNLMGSYASQLTQDERWKVITYIKELQAKEYASQKGVSADEALNHVLRTSASMTGGSTYAGGDDLDFLLEDGDIGEVDEEALASATSEEQEAIAAAANAKSNLGKWQTTKWTKGTTVALNRVFFAPMSAQLKESSFGELDQLAEIMKANPKSKIEIGGHTTNKGGKKLNLRLSKKRAKAVVDYLVEKGVRASTLTFKGYGDTNPIGSNETKEGRQKNRRVEIKVIE